MIQGQWRKGWGPTYHHFFRENPDSKSRSLCGLIAYPRTMEPTNYLSENTKCRTCERIRKGYV